MHLAAVNLHCWHVTAAADFWEGRRIKGEKVKVFSHLVKKPDLVSVFTQSHVQMQLWVPLRGNRLCECSALKQSLCSPQNQFNLTFQEWSSVPAAERGQKGLGGIKKLGHRGSVSSESVFGKAPGKEFLLPDRRNRREQPTTFPRPSSQRQPSLIDRGGSSFFKVWHNIVSSCVLMGARVKHKVCLTVNTLDTLMFNWEWVRTENDQYISSLTTLADIIGLSLV